jgi:glycosyltransferase involved in cell wall biosynthesis
VSFTGNVPRDTLRGFYDSHTALLFPSLHDSSGNVVLEALARGLPVLCLACGGPARIITPDCGVAVPVDDRCESDVIADLAAAAFALVENPSRFAALSDAARHRAAHFILTPRIAAFYNVLARSESAPNRQKFFASFFQKRRILSSVLF